MGRSKRFIGLLVDKGFGLAAWTPSFLVFPAAIGFLCKKRPTIGSTSFSLLVGWSTATWVALPCTDGAAGQTDCRCSTFSCHCNCYSSRPFQKISFSFAFCNNCRFNRLDLDRA